MTLMHYGQVVFLKAVPNPHGRPSIITVRHHEGFPKVPCIYEDAQFCHKHCSICASLGQQNKLANNDLMYCPSQATISLPVCGKYKMEVKILLEIENVP